jgi:CelD/BcsL family acetyltransferase involved in cellulose biosynthesis
LYERIYRIETRSWKGMEGSGFVDGGMRAFYAAMVPMLAERGAMRAIIGRVGETDVCFIFGGIFAGTFRGLQMSFDENFRELELGNAMQILMLQRLQYEGLSIYDLGSDMAYKARWSDQVFETVTLVARP